MCKIMGLILVYGEDPIETRARTPLTEISPKCYPWYMDLRQRPKNFP